VMALKAQFDSINNLPYFVNVTELSLMFDCEQAAVNAQANGSIANYVFSHIRKQLALSKFLVNVLSELRVVLSCYDSGELDYCFSLSCLRRLYLRGADCDELDRPPSPSDRLSQPVCFSSANAQIFGTA
jgi:hypothetical protein